VVRKAKLPDYLNKGVIKARSPVKRAPTNFTKSQLSSYSKSPVPRFGMKGREVDRKAANKSAGMYAPGSRYSQSSIGFKSTMNTLGRGSALKGKVNKDKSPINAYRPTNYSLRSSAGLV
jgi:hypothetical protein